MMGRLMYDLGQMEERKRRENERESSKAGKGSFSWAWEMDALGEERDRCDDNLKFCNCSPKLITTSFQGRDDRHQPNDAQPPENQPDNPRRART